MFRHRQFLIVEVLGVPDPKTSTLRHPKILRPSAPHSGLGKNGLELLPKPKDWKQEQHDSLGIHEFKAELGSAGADHKRLYSMALRLALNSIAPKA